MDPINCQECSFPITASTDGLMWILHDEVNQTEQNERVWREEHEDELGGVTLNELMHYPESAKWRVTHQRCAHDDAYGFPIPDSTTAWLDDIAHLLEKTWLQATDFADLLREASKAEGRFASAG